MSNTETSRYATMDRDDCGSYYWSEIAPEMQAEDPEHETPTYRWLTNEYPGFVKHRKRAFDLSPGDFYAEYNIPPQQDADSSLFGFVDHDATREAIEDYLDELADRDDWQGYLLPSASAATGHRTTETIKRRFKTIARTCKVTVDGETPTPKYGRRFWYTTYTRGRARCRPRLRGRTGTRQ